MRFLASTWASRRRWFDLLHSGKKVKMRRKITWTGRRRKGVIMTVLATRPMTAEQFFEWVQRPENRDRHFELERGEVVEMSRPGERHGYICGNTSRILGNFTFQR